MINLLCSVRNCYNLLQRKEKTFLCPLGHSFDISRRGYVNLLQPQDRRSLSPGDSQEVVQARHRLLNTGQDIFFVKEIIKTVESFKFHNDSKILDVGCGEGFYLKSILDFCKLVACGLDISTPAIDLAAKHSPDTTWVIANADKFLPFPEEEFDIVMSITARKNPSEFKRILSKKGVLIVIVPSSDDLIELREVLMGKGILQDRSEQVLDLFKQHFKLLESNVVSYRQVLNKSVLTDLLLTTYRGARLREQERFSQIEQVEVTFSRQIFCFQTK